jgi:acyl-coenzyme A thioesterase PaaI-like protein
MGNKEHDRALEKMYASAPCNQCYEPTIHISHGAAEVIIPIQEKFLHSGRTAHGGPSISRPLMMRPILQ